MRIAHFAHLLLSSLSVYKSPGTFEYVAFSQVASRMHEFLQHVRGHASLSRVKTIMSCALKQRWKYVILHCVNIIAFCTLHIERF